jgi:phospholipid transport system transporter-binding protein
MNKRKPGAATRATRRGRSGRSTPGAGTEHKTVSDSFAVAAECTVADAGLLKIQLAKLLDESGIVTLDISAVQRIDTAGLQVIAAFVRERESRGRLVQWHGHAPALSNAARLLGLSDVLRLPTATAQGVGIAL